MSIGELRCPAIRSLVTRGQLRHVDFFAQVHDVVRVLSGTERELSPGESGSIANIAGFFAIHNHAVNENTEGGSLRRRLRRLRELIKDLVDAGSAFAGKDTDRKFDLRFFKSRGDHPGTVDFFTNDEAGVFDGTHFEETMAQFAVGDQLSIDGVAQMILRANRADQPKADPIDLAKSAGEWALMVCALGDPISVSDLRSMYRDGEPTRLLEGTKIATALQWVAMTIRISKEIAGEKLATHLHSAFGNEFNDDDEQLCPCIRCNPTAWV